MKLNLLVYFKLSSEKFLFGDFIKTNLVVSDFELFTDWIRLSHLIYISLVIYILSTFYGNSRYFFAKTLINSFLKIFYFRHLTILKPVYQYLPIVTPS